MQLLTDYKAVRQEIFDYFGYQEDWLVIPLDDSTEYLWYLDDHGVLFAGNMEDFETDSYYQNEIFAYRHLPKHVYEGPEYTMVMVDTHADGNKFLQIFDNTKRLKEYPA